jgi:hypothetical protein
MCNTFQQVAPINEYDHSSGRCSVTGGYVYRGSLGTLPFGSYVFGDYCTGEIFLLDNGTRQLLMDTGSNIPSFGEDEAGEIYVVGHGGTLHRIINPTAQPPEPFAITAAFISRRSTGEQINPITVITNAKKFDVVVTEEGASPNQSSIGATALLNDTPLITTYTTTNAGTPIFVAKLRKKMLRQPVTLKVEVVRANGARSNQILLQVVAAEQ